MLSSELRLACEQVLFEWVRSVLAAVYITHGVLATSKSRQKLTVVFQLPSVFFQATSGSVAQRLLCTVFQFGSLAATCFICNTSKRGATNVRSKERKENEKERQDNIFMICLKGLRKSKKDFRIAGLQAEI
jgi:hypothetical protein